MPELPEVETVVRDLRRLGVVGRRIRSISVRWPGCFLGMTPEDFVRTLRGRRILGVRRRAKFICWQLSEGWTLLVHLRMTGQFQVRHSDGATLGGAAGMDERHQHVVVRLDDGRELRFRDPRKFGRWVLTRTPEQWLGRLGPEPLERTFRQDRFVRGLRQHQRQLKPLLLDQSFLAGLGNIYVDEALWAARLHPRRRADTLTEREAATLYQAIRRILRRAIRARGTTLGVLESNFRSADGRRGSHQLRLRVFQRTGRPCPRCGTAVRRVVVGQRGTHICPRCQPEPIAFCASGQEERERRRSGGTQPRRTLGAGR